MTASALPRRPHRNTVRANLLKSQLLAEMGNVCWGCGSTSMLQVDHTHGRDWKVSSKNFLHRVNIYIREWREGKVRCLCKECNEARHFMHVELPPPPGVVVMRDGVAEPF